MVHAPIVGAAHKVCDRIDTGFVIAGVPADRATKRSVFFGSCVAHAIAAASTAALEGAAFSTAI
jgi:hypothetical protein